MFGGAVEQHQGEITAQEQWDAGADVALPDFEIFFRLFKLLLLSEMESAWPTHLQLPPSHRILCPFGKGTGLRRSM